MADSEVKLKITGDTAQLSAAMKKARDDVQKNTQGMVAAVNKFGSSFNSAIGGITKMQAALGALGAVISVGAIVNGLKNTVEAMDKLEETSQKTGVGVEALQVFQMAAKLSGVEADSLTKGLVKLSKAMYEGSAAFEKIGVSTKDSGGQIKLLDKVFLEIADKFASMPDGVEKTALAIQLLGKSGADNIPILNMGSSAIQKLREEMGYLFTQDDANRASAFNDNIDLTTRVLEGMKMQVLSGMLPAMIQVSQSFKDAGKDADYFRTMGEGLGDVLKWVAGAAYLVSSSMQTVGTRIGNLVEKARRGWQMTREGKSAEDIYAMRDQLDALSSTSTDDIWKNYEDKLKKLDTVFKTPDPRKRGGGTTDDSADAKKAASEAEARLKRGEQAIMQLDRETQKTGELSKVSQMYWEITQGQYKDLAPAHKERLLTLAEEVDKLNMLKDSKEAITEYDKKQSEEINKTRQAIEDQIATIAEQADTFNMTASEISLYKLALQGATPEQLALAEALLRAKERMEEIKKVMEVIKTPQDTYNETVSKLKVLLDETSISLDQYNAGVKKATDTLAANTKDKFADLKAVIEGWGKDSAAAIADFAMGGKTSFSDMINSMIADMLKMMVYQNLTGPLFSGLSSMVGGGSFAGGWTSFRGGKATGGSVSSGKMYEVNETGIPELLNIGNRQFLMMGNNSGAVAALQEANGSSGSSRRLTGEGSEGGNATIINNYITANDAKSFDDMCKRNGASITTVINEALRNNSGLRNTIKRTR